MALFARRPRRSGVVVVLLLISTIPAGGQGALSLPEGLSPYAIAAASTPEAHRAISDAYAREAENLRGQADLHRHMGEVSAELLARRRTGADDRRTPSELANMAHHCRALTQELDDAAKAADALSQAHRMMAVRADSGPR